MTEVLLVDIGNSRIKWRVQDLDPSAAGDPTSLDDAWRGASDALATTEAATLVSRWRSLADRPVRHAFVCNVADETVARAVEVSAMLVWPSMRWHPVTATATAHGVVSGYAEPSRLGPDRWMALVGARVARPAQSLLVCSFGTATTIDLLLDDDASTTAQFVGGLILPGFAAMRAALIGGTARLPDVAGRVVDFADETGDAIASGIATAQIGALEHALVRARARVGRRALAVVLAGGAVAQLEGLLGGLDAPAVTVPDLVLRGLAEIARRDLVAYHATI